ncbi:MAG: stage IV sporulation protein A [Firmicutes bacterium]|jgi:stage IV sporulation protein A|nr:stage IV sporulation protein A [Bacillota bacterium]MDH7495113.1 stage IV sporulation protein A [Bacillota bacterium]
METFDIFQDIATRTGGDIYIGVVGPVRTGKSTFIKRFMDLLVLPNISDMYDKQRSVDELPQSGGGRTIMTTEPKFVPSEAVEVELEDNVKVRVRLVDCVGYTVRGALGYEDEAGPRMVVTPWFDYEIPFEDAAEFGTRKVIADHSTIGLVVLTDGSITEIPRENYAQAEERVIAELRQLRKPFVAILNSVAPWSREAKDLATDLSQKYQVPVIPLDCMRMDVEDVKGVLREVLYEFPVREVSVRLPVWLGELAEDHWARQRFQEAVVTTVKEVKRIRDIHTVVNRLSGEEFVSSADLTKMELGTGSVVIDLDAPRSLFFQVLQEVSGLEVESDHHLLRLMKELSTAKREYDKIADGLRDARELGYGIVMPLLDELTFEEPELIRQGSRFGVRLKASAPSIHMIRANIETEVTTNVGTERQGEELVRRLSEEFEKDPDRIWNTDFLGKSLHELVKEGIESKLYRMPENAQQKLQETLQKIVNEGSGGLICIIL